MKNVLKMSSRFGLMTFAAMSTLVVTSASTFKEKNDKKITICHIPPGNPSNRHSITISVHALSAHLAHGDSVGSCDNTAPETPTEPTPTEPIPTEPTPTDPTPTDPDWGYGGQM